MAGRKRHETLGQIVVEHILFESDVAEVITLAGVHHQIDLGGVVGRIHTNRRLGEAHVEITGVIGCVVKRGLGGRVVGMNQPLAGGEFSVLERLLNIGKFVARTVDGKIDGGDFGRRPALDTKGGLPGLVLVALGAHEVRLDNGIVITVWRERGLDLVRRKPVQAPDLTRRPRLFGLVGDRQRPTHVVQQGVLDPVDTHVNRIGHGRMNQYADERQGHDPFSQS